MLTPALRFVAVCTLAAAAGLPHGAAAHGFAGKRYFPATLAVEDPFPADELDLLADYREKVGAGDEQADVAGMSVEFSKRLSRRLAVSVGGSYLDLDPAHEPADRGWENLELGAKWLAALSARREAVLSLGFEAELGGTGNLGEAEPYDVYAPSVLFGKGFGGLPEHLEWLRPLALTGAIAYRIPQRSDAPRVLATGLTLQYAPGYLQSFVRDVGLPRFLTRTVPLIEIPIETCVDEGCGGEVTGTVNPGLVYHSHWGQLSAELPIPINHSSGDRPGLLLQVHFYLDDLAPGSLGRPLLD